VTSGHWLLVFGHGPTSESWASQIAAQCERRGVAFELVPVDEVDDAALSLFNVLVVVLPARSDEPRPLDRFTALIKAYRNHHGAGLRAPLSGGVTWTEIGVVYVFDDASLHPRAELVSIRHLICLHDLVYDDTDLNPFGAYQASVPEQPGVPTGVREYDKGTVQEMVTSWNVPWSLKAVVAVRRRIDGFRSFFDERRFHDLRRPVQERDKNRFVLLLDEPGYRPEPAVCDTTKWVAGGQRVVTQVLADLAEKFDVRRPPERAGKKNPQTEFRQLYHMLCEAEEILRPEE
jgi:hypothetical protein